MNLQDAIITLQQYQNAHQRGHVELDSPLMLHALPYAVEVVLEHLLPKEKLPVTTESSFSEEERNRISKLLNGEG
jgi:hypothetical protein